ncbi:hypothetical protein FIBSPDRAFT_1051964 [Athelia psychrophila]|uniref:Uncharacterized protein n=1 Tax=Athelia psychrophila TaxID=1759441 RepID=A0A165Y371_9AGAM|nr:hypothetical protein FIBSPDRAFT_1051964 [Fibularhizoctonia sp. CBS 109695]
MVCLSYEETTDEDRSDEARGHGVRQRETDVFYLEPAAWSRARWRPIHDLASDAPFAKVPCLRWHGAVWPTRPRSGSGFKLWLWQRRRDRGADGHRVASRLTARQLLAMMNLRAGGAAAWFPDGAAACNGAHCSLLTVNGYGRTVLEPAKAVENGFWLV